MKKTFIKRFEINNLFGYKNLSFNFDSPVKVLIGENGFGKTTILNALYWVLSADYYNLLRIKFESISVEFDDTHKYYFTKEQVKQYCQIQESSKVNRMDKNLVDFVKRNIPPSLMKRFVDSVFMKDGQREFIKLINENSGNIGLPIDLVHQVVSYLANMEICKPLLDLSTYVNSTGYKIVYYPTYRRIEEDLKNILKNKNVFPRQMSHNVDESLFDNNSIIKFGMTDVESRINKIRQEISTSSLSGFAEVSGSMIGKLLETDDKTDLHPFDYEEIKIVLSRVGDNISKAEKESILQQIKIDNTLSKQNKYLRYFLNQLLLVYNKQKTYDLAIKNFVNVCNKYLTDKEFIYNESLVSLPIYRKDDVSKQEPIELKQLSSGEKQVVSIFSQLYLELDKKFVILFDEPELSLSIFWQEKLLPDMIASNRCEFMLAVTHSPFIYNNELKDNTVGIKEFEKWDK